MMRFELNYNEKRRHIRLWPDSVNVTINTVLTVVVIIAVGLLYLYIYFLK
jgi:hypothetical protein